MNSTRHHTRTYLLSLTLFFATGCLNVKAPERIEIDTTRSEHVDSARVPQITTVAQGRAELDKAYAYIRHLEDKNKDLQHDNSRLRHERDDLKRQIKKHD